MQLGSVRGKWVYEVGRPRYIDGLLRDVLTLRWPEFHALYPEIKKNTYKGKRSYWKTKLREGKITMPPENAPRPTKTWTVSAFDRVNNEWTSTENHSYDHSADLAEQFEPAAPANITPSRNKPVRRDHRLLFVFSDAQIDYRRLEDGSLEPIHDERAIRVAQLMCADLQPDEIINCGDTVDLAALSKFKADSNHFQRTLGPSFQRVHDMYAQFRADSPHAKIVEVDSNHNTRLKDYFLRNAPDLYGMRRPGEEGYPMFTYPYMANLGHVGVNWVSGYGAAEYVYGAEYDKPPIVFKHGQIVASNASTAARESKENPETHVVRGHGHRVEQHTRTTRDGHYLISQQIGALCRITGEVPSYHSAVDDNGGVVRYQENWQQSVLVVKDYEGDYDFHTVYIRDGLAIYEGKIYNG